MTPELTTRHGSEKEDFNKRRDEVHNKDKHRENKEDDNDRTGTESHLALGPYTGGNVYPITLGQLDTFFEQYIGTGPLIVKTKGGEAKAFSSDLIIFSINDDKESPDWGEDYVVVMPVEMALMIKDDLVLDAEHALDEETFGSEMVRRLKVNADATWKKRQSEKKAVSHTPLKSIAASTATKSNPIIKQ